MVAAEIVVLVVVEWVYYLMNFEMIVKMIDELVESVPVVMNVEVMEFDIDSKQQYHYVEYSKEKQKNYD